MPDTDTEILPRCSTGIKVQINRYTPTIKSLMNRYTSTTKSIVNRYIPSIKSLETDSNNKLMTDNEFNKFLIDEMVDY